MEGCALRLGRVCTSAKMKNEGRGERNDRWPVKEREMRCKEEEGDEERCRGLYTAI